MKLLILFLLLISQTEKEVGKNVQFMVNKNHTLTPVLPVKFIVSQEDGGLADGLLTCSIYSRDLGELADESHAMSTILKCGNKVFKIEGIIFTQSASKEVK